MKPRRIQRKRSKGWRMPPNTVCVSRPGRWGNPWKVGDVPHFTTGEFTDESTRLTAMECIDEFRSMILDNDENIINVRRELRGKHLACWCKLCEAHRDGKPLGEFCRDCEPCHADVLLHIANPEPEATP